MQVRGKIEDVMTSLSWTSQRREASVMAEDMSAENISPSVQPGSEAGGFRAGRVAIKGTPRVATDTRFLHRVDLWIYNASMRGGLPARSAERAMGRNGSRK